MIDRLCQKVPWWAVSLAIHVVVLVELTALGIRLPLVGEETPNVGLSEGKDEIFTVEACRLPAIGPAPAEMPPLPVVDTSFNIPEGASDGNQTADDLEQPRDPVPLGPPDSVERGRPGQLARARVPSMASGTIGASSPSRGAIHDALQWLVRHQDADGGWSVMDYVRHCTKSCSPNPGRRDCDDTGVTALSVLALLQGGVSPGSPTRLGDSLRRGLDWLVTRQEVEGMIGSRAASKYMYGHLLATRALCLAVARGAAGFTEPAKNAVEFTLAAQNPGKGWRYSFRCGDNDALVTGFAVLALREARQGGFSVPKAAFDGARAWYDSATESNYNRVEYNGVFG